MYEHLYLKNQTVQERTRKIQVLQSQRIASAVRAQQLRTEKASAALADVVEKYEKIELRADKLLQKIFNDIERLEKYNAELAGLIHKEATLSVHAGRAEQDDEDEEFYD